MHTVQSPESLFWARAKTEALLFSLSPESESLNLSRLTVLPWWLFSEECLCLKGLDEVITVPLPQQCRLL